jgi:glycosyltransferase involved in cell wall biosynthesis
MASETETKAAAPVPASRSRSRSRSHSYSPEPEISVVVPVLDEEGNIAPLYQELSTVLDAYGKRYEILFIDDGSTDASFALLKSIHHRDDRVRVIRFRKNFGQTAALAAGFAEARAPVIVTLDADLQNDPADIPRLVERLDAGFDIVCGWRRERKDAYLSRRLPSQVANWLISVTTGVHLHDYGCTLKAFRSEVVKSLHLYGEMHRFIPAVASGFGVAIDEMVVGHRPRREGKSKYGISRTFRVALDLVTIKFLLNYSSRPLQIFGSAGFLMGGAGFALGCYLTWVKLWLGEAIGGRPLLLLASLLMLGGLQLVSLGLLGELLARVYHENRESPPYAVRETLDRTERENGRDEE